MAFATARILQARHWGSQWRFGAFQGGGAGTRLREGALGNRGGRGDLGFSCREKVSEMPQFVEASDPCVLKGEGLGFRVWLVEILETFCP